MRKVTFLPLKRLHLVRNRILYIVHKQLVQILTVLFLLSFAGCTSIWQWQKDEPDDTQNEQLSATEADSGLPEWDDENLTVEQVLERTPQWMQEAKDELALGDSTTAEQQMMRSILALQNVLLEVPTATNGTLAQSAESLSQPKKVLVRLSPKRMSKVQKPIRTALSTNSHSTRSLLSSTPLSPKQMRFHRFPTH